MKIARPALRYHGGKWKLAPWLIAHFPEHRVYVEPFGGGASVLLRKARSYAEVYNDLDSEVVGLFRILRDRVLGAQLVEALRLTPFARAEFNEAYTATDDLIERARRLVIRSFMGFGSDGAVSEWRTGFRANSNRSGTTPAHDWHNYSLALPALIERMQGVVVENRPAADVIRQHDSEHALFYVDPPYPHGTRKARNNAAGSAVRAYRFELDDDDHRALLAQLRHVRGAVVLSSYPNQIYDDALGDWHRRDVAALADGARGRTEVIWSNRPFPTGAPKVQLRLIEGAA